MKFWHTTAALEWLTVVLSERFGHTFDLRLHIDRRSIIMTLPKQSGCITLAIESASFTRTDSNIACFHWDSSLEGWQSPLNLPLPAPSSYCLPSPLISSTTHGMHISYDVLGLTYWILTRQEEVGRTDLDRHDRFSAFSSHAYKYGYLERPIVDEWLHILGQVIQKVWPCIALKRHTFSMKVSHDVDAPSRYTFQSWGGVLRASVKDLLSRYSLLGMIFGPWIKLKNDMHLHRRDPFNTFEWIMDLSDAHGLTSAFYFMCGRTVNALDADYDPEHPAILELMLTIHLRGHEIGLHPSYGTYRKPELINSEADRLRKILVSQGINQSYLGGRMHYLRWINPDTPNGLELAKLDYDSTLCYADFPGFRCGTCHEYPYFDPVEKKILNLRIRPLVAMEHTIMSSQYMGLSHGENALLKFKQLKNACRSVDGCFTLLWHNSRLCSKKERALYAKVIDL